MKPSHMLAVRGRAQRLGIERDAVRNSRPRHGKARLENLGRTRNLARKYRRPLRSCNVRSSRALRRVINPIKPDTRTSRRNGGKSTAETGGSREQLAKRSNTTPVHALTQTNAAAVRFQETKALPSLQP